MVTGPVRSPVDSAMSFARRNSRTSRSSSAIRRASPVDVPGRRPSSTSACLNQPRNDSVPMPNSRATRATTPKRWPPCSAIRSCAIRTARSRSSGGYLFCVGCDPMLHPHFQGMEPPGIPGRFRQGHRADRTSGPVERLMRHMGLNGRVRGGRNAPRWLSEVRQLGRPRRHGDGHLREHRRGAENVTRRRQFIGHLSGIRCRPPVSVRIRAGQPTRENPWSG
jgi:hypothetical protein